MAAPVYIQVYDKQQLVYAAEFTEPVELGRQSEDESAVYTRRRQGDRWRAVIAKLKELTVSRKHVLIEPLAPDRVRLTNRSNRLPVRLPDNVELKAGESMELLLPAVIALGKKQVRLQGPQEDNEPLQGLSEKTLAPGQLSLAAAQMSALSLAASRAIELETV
ncbi:MAG TPA: hypothetical protein VKU02_09865, partial [Gemmataceae bacterium]|nr:hypothetical protein [Gemmataceae bacterium]